MRQRFKPLPAAEYLHTLLKYDRKTGTLTWRTRRGGRAPAGAVAGVRQERGHRVIMIDGENYQASRVIWRMVTGVDPGRRQVDHVDLDPSNNRLSNLRLASHAENQANRRVAPQSGAGLRGVTRTPGGKYVAGMVVDGRRRHLGTFPTAQAAHDFWWAEYARLYGDFARKE